MPLYEYECLQCKERVEIIQKFSDPPYSICPKCGGGDMKKLFSSPAIQFKGSGFYKTDYATGSASGSKSDTKTESSAASKSESKTESKTEASSTDTKKSD